MDATKLESLGAMVAEVDATGPVAQAEVQAQAEAEADAEEQAREWGMIAYTIGGALAMLAPELREVYTERACMDWGRAVVPVADKYGWNGPSGVPEIGLAISTMGLAVPSFLVIRAKLAHLKAQREAAEAAAKRGDGGAAEAGTGGAANGG